MISIYPEERETLVISYSRDEVFLRLSKAISSTAYEKGIAKSLKGWVEDDRFEMTIKLRRQQMFMPLIRGGIESTSKGSLVFIRYGLFPGTKLLMTFWSIVLPLIAVGIGFEFKTYFVPSVLVGIVVLIHIIARANFKLHLQSTRKILNDILI